ncbi:MAG: efflux RND transporter periplasmic adaptor subunit [Pseudomonadota bacterium]
MSFLTENWQLIAGAAAMFAVGFLVRGMRLNASLIIAIMIAAGIGGWMYTGDLIIGGQADPNAVPIVEREKKRSSSLFQVRVRELQPEARPARLLIRGRTKADKMVSVRAETAGTLEKRPVNKGDRVKPGDLLCVINQGVRQANLTQAEAQLTQAKADFQANEELVEKGFTTKSRLRSLRAAYDAARAAVASAKWELSRTEVRATTHGIVVSPAAEVGDNLTPGGVCLTLMNSDPMLFVGQVSERDISQLKLGQPVGTQLVTGETVLGKLTHIAPIADPQTRTFEIEVSLPNPDERLRDGVTANSLVELASEPAFRIRSSWLTLSDNGTIGVRVVDEDDKVAFMAVKILSEPNDAMWVSGLKPGQRVITVGHEYVIAGEKVIPVKDTASTEKPGDASSTFDGKAKSEKTQ